MRIALLDASSVFGFSRGGERRAHLLSLCTQRQSPAGAEVRPRTGLDADVQVLMKPFTYDQLASKVREVLEHIDEGSLRFPSNGSRAHLRRRVRSPDACKRQQEKTG
jgi:hypothetical protein